MRHVSCTVILTEMSWTKGYYWPSIQTQAGYLGRSEDSICRYQRELGALGLLHIDRYGPKNIYYPRSVPGARRSTRMGAPQHTRTGAALTLKEEYVNKTLYVPPHPHDPTEDVPYPPKTKTFKTLVFRTISNPKTLTPFASLTLHHLSRQTVQPLGNHLNAIPTHLPILRLPQRLVRSSMRIF